MSNSRKIEITSTTTNECCNCKNKDVSGSHHFCSISSKRVHFDCYPIDADPDIVEKFGSRAPCARCSAQIIQKSEKARTTTSTLTTNRNSSNKKRQKT